METQNLLTLAAAILTFIASIVATIVSTYNARLQRFARERWWERKADAYSKIIDALSSLIYYFEVHYDSALLGNEISEERRAEIEEHWRVGYIEIKKATAMGAFLISEEAEQALKTFWDDVEAGLSMNDWFKMIEDHYSAARKCMGIIVSAAKKELSMNV